MYVVLVESVRPSQKRPKSLRSFTYLVPDAGFLSTVAALGCALFLLLTFVFWWRWRKQYTRRTSVLAELRTLRVERMKSRGMGEPEATQW